jgi:nitroreductase
MIGFDQSAVAKEFGLSDLEIPVMLVTVGYPGATNWPQKPRKAVNDVLQFV